MAGKSPVAARTSSRAPSTRRTRAARRSSPTGGQPHLDHRGGARRPPRPGVEHRLDLGPGLADLAHHAVDQERRVRLDDLQQIGLQRPAVGALGPHQPHRRRRTAVVRSEAPEGGQDGGQIGGPDPDQPRADSLQHPDHERPLGVGRRAPVAAQPGDEIAEQGVEGEPGSGRPAVWRPSGVSLVRRPFRAPAQALRIAVAESRTAIQREPSNCARMTITSTVRGWREHPRQPPDRAPEAERHQNHQGSMFRLRPASWAAGCCRPGR